jgi:TrmH family RNA methyltransferase
LAQKKSAGSHLDNLSVVLVHPRNPLNIGAVARAMSNFGVHCLRLVNPYSIAFRDARSAVNAADVLRDAEEFATVAEAVADCNFVVGTTAVRNRALQHPLRRLDEDGGSMIREQLHAGRLALLFGSEKTGLSNDDFTHCHWLLNIATESDHISMNLAQAVAVCLYEIARPALLKSELKSNKKRPNPATAGQIEQITTALLESLHISGYVKPGNDAVSEKKVRRLLMRLNLEPMDAKVFLGMMRQIIWKLRQTPGSTKRSGFPTTKEKPTPIERIERQP